jgi:hypothetical protein
MQMKKLYFLVLMLVSLSIQAQNYSGGSGTVADPYLIANKTDLKYLSDNDATEGSKYFKQTADIVFTAVDFASGGDFYYGGLGFKPFNFNGTYDGNGHVIENLTINRPSLDNVGFFKVFQGTVKKLGLKNVNFFGANAVAGISGQGEDADISNCYVTGNISGTQFCGGIFGYGDECIVTNSYASVNISNATSGSGPFAGYVTNCAISRCYSSGTSSTGAGFIGFEDGANISSVILIHK